MQFESEGRIGPSRMFSVHKNLKWLNNIMCPILVILHLSSFVSILPVSHNLF